MGCDIHVMREHHDGNQWNCLEEVNKIREDDYTYCEYANSYTPSDYLMFGFLSAGVRYDVKGAFEQRGLPDDVTEPVKWNSDNWDVDGHSHSWLGIEEITRFIDDAPRLRVLGDIDYETIEALEGVKKHILPKFTEEQLMTPEKYRIVFWFDN